MTNIIRNSNGTWTIESETRTVDLTASEVCALADRFMKYSFRQSIEDKLHEMNQDTIDLEEYPYSFEELVDEVYDYFEDRIDHGDLPNENDIYDTIIDVARFYHMELV